MRSQFPEVDSANNRFATSAASNRNKWCLYFVGGMMAADITAVGATLVMQTAHESQTTSMSVAGVDPMIHKFHVAEGVELGIGMGLSSAVIAVAGIVGAATRTESVPVQDSFQASS